MPHHQDILGELSKGKLSHTIADWPRKQRRLARSRKVVNAVWETREVFVPQPEQSQHIAQ
jgi:hypothetical protein